MTGVKSGPCFPMVQKWGPHPDLERHIEQTLVEPRLRLILRTGHGLAWLHHAEGGGEPARWILGAFSS